MAFSIAPDVATYATRQPYITAQEFLNAPTGVDVFNLVTGASNVTNTQALATQIIRASSWADEICHQILSATVDTDSRVCRVQRLPGMGAGVKIPLKYTPILAVTQVDVGRTPAAMTTVTDLSNVWIDRGVATVPTVGCALPWGTEHAYTSVQYVNGYANTVLTGNVAVGDMAVTVMSPLGVMPGQTLTLSSGIASEQVVVSTAWVPTITPGTVSIPLQAATVNSYNTGDTFTALPGAIKQAVIHLTCILIKTRGAESIELSSLSGPTNIVSKTVATDTQFLEAMALLNNFRRVI